MTPMRKPGPKRSSGLNPLIRLRPAEPDDQAFLYDLYASTRIDELSVTQWQPSEKEGFLRMQFEAQRRDYNARYPTSEHSIILLGSAPIGRIWVDRAPTETCLLDIAILPEHRNAGIGTALIKGLIAEAAAGGLPLRHAVFKANTSALRLYMRLGFQVVEDTGVYLFMEIPPPRSLQPQP